MNNYVMTNVTESSGDWRPALHRASALAVRRNACRFRGGAGGRGAGAKGQRRKQRTYGGREARAERHRNQRLTSSVHGAVVRGRWRRVEASGAPPARARASWVAYSLVPGALPLRYRLVTEL